MDRMIPCFLMLINCVLAFDAYSKDIFAIGHLNHDDLVDFDCDEVEEQKPVNTHKHKLTYIMPYETVVNEPWKLNTNVDNTFREIDPINKYQQIINQLLFGANIPDRDEIEDRNVVVIYRTTQDNISLDALAQFPNGNIMRSEIFLNKTSVHLPMPENMHRGHLHLKLTDDYMQTGLNAFSILLLGNLNDVLRLPRHYVLKSAKTISMMKIAREKLVATWMVVKGDKSTEEITPNVLEQYRPLFKYLSGQEMARLNLSDSRILTYIGTHADLNRHQVGVVASAYIKMNPHWTQPKYLNLMNNLLCGVPMIFMRKVPEHTYLQLTHQLFYHIHACDPLQRRFYYAMMTRTQALGKPYSWSARDVSRLGMLLTEIHGPDLATVNPEAMSGITAQVMLKIPAESLKHITEVQLRFISPKPLNILAKKLRDYQEEQRINSKGYCLMILKPLSMILLVLTCLLK